MKNFEQKETKISIYAIMVIAVVFVLGKHNIVTAWADESKSAQINYTTNGSNITFTCTVSGINNDTASTLSHINYMWYESDGKNERRVGGNSNTFTTSMAGKKEYKYKCRVQLVYKSCYALIDNAYLAIHNRHVDPSGQATWFDSIVNHSYSHPSPYLLGMTPVNEPAGLALSLIISDEYMTRWEKGICNTDSLIKSCYKFLLGRDACKGDIDYWRARYREFNTYGANVGICFGTYYVTDGMIKLVNAIASSPECQNYMSGKYSYNAGIKQYTYTTSDIETKTFSEYYETSYRNLPVHSVTFNVALNGGGWKDGTTKSRDVMSYKENERIYQEAPIKPGWKFIGWNTDSKAHTANQYVLSKNTDITVYAIYIRDIDMHFIDISKDNKQTKRAYNSEKEVKATSPVASTKALSKMSMTDPFAAIGWSENKQIDNKDIVSGNDKKLIKYTQQQSISLSTDRGNYTFYAVYKGSAILRYDANLVYKDNIISDIPVRPEAIKRNVYVNSGNTSEFKASAIKLTGLESYEADDGKGYIHTFTFKGWNTKPDGSGDMYMCGQDYFIKENTTLYAQWNEKIRQIKYNILYDGNGAQYNIPDSQTVNFEDITGISEKIPEKLGYEFISWNTSNDGSGTEYLPSQQVSRLTTKDNGEFELFANWRKKELQLVKASSTAYNDTILKRTKGDDEWFDKSGHVKIGQFAGYPDENCEQIWKIESDGRQVRIK